ncbi:pentatricopeptide repeat-containing protein at5g52850 chloroplastic [Phtheirospermum japonicum]|uniref:Pentatricopeptide repeat-containing protein at5g52850 chloroplastic n=1 Tax=Phtheirospermum japonicum TaxID=374723 RepID=A0A830C5E7_9LAMI|nr:pentatricopeptide repeat-containing protein at5g52850 chloroplastic [Phtheirospermum japonicum]
MSRINLIEKTCSKIIYFCNKNFLKDGICIHSPMLKLGIQDNLLLSNNLLSLYAKCCGVETARHLFDEMPHRDVVSWTSVLSAYVNNENHEEALELFNSMKISGEKPNEFTFSNVLRSCSALKNLLHGSKVHAWVIKHGFESNPISCSSLIELYSKSGFLENAVRVFNGMQIGDTLSWTSMISSFVQAGDWVRALLFFICMIKQRVYPNEYTFAKLLSACSLSGTDSGKLIHAQMIVWGVELNLVLKTALVDMYAKCREMENAVKVFSQTSEQDVKLYTTLIAGLAKHGSKDDFFRAFLELRFLGHRPNSYTLCNIIEACANLGDMRTGKQLHCYSIVSGFGEYKSVSNGLIDLYGKCRSVIDAQKLFDEMSEPNVISWNSLIHIFALNGHVKSSLSALEDMRLAGIRPDSHTMSIVLFACSKGGLVDMGVEYFHSLRELYDIKPQFYHYNLLVDLLGKDGRLEEAAGLVRSMSFCLKNVTVYKRLLCACKLHGNVILGEEMARRGLELDPFDMEFHGIIASMYDEAGRLDLGDNMRTLMKEGGLRKSLVSRLVANC